MKKEFKIEPGIIISKLDLKDGDNIIITVDRDIWDVDTASEIYQIASKVFPNNNIVITLKGIEITADAGPSPK
jgi:short-subunit dehydrogenase involved in D-alanine esterification of teichoic acids